MNHTNIRRLFIMEFFAQAVAIFSLLPVMYSERGNLSSFQVGTVLATLSLATIIAEIPTGAFADRYSRKWSIVLSKIGLLFGFGIMFIYPTYPGYLLGMVLLGIADSMSSGALQAYLYEDLGENKSEFAHYNARLWVVVMGGFIVGAGIASLVGPSYNVLLVSSMITSALSTIFALGLRSDYAHKKSVQSHTIVSNTKAAFTYIVSNNVLLYATASILLMKLLVDVLIEYIPLFYKDAGAPTRLIPVLFFAGNIITLLLFWHSKKLTALLVKKELITGFLFVLLLVATAYSGGAYAIFGMFWFVRFTRLLFIQKEGTIHHLLLDRHRATIGSMYSMGAKLLAALTFVVIGSLSNTPKGIIVPIVAFSALLYALYALLTYKSRSIQT